MNFIISMTLYASFYIFYTYYIIIWVHEWCCHVHNERHPARVYTRKYYIIIIILINKCFFTVFQLLLLIVAVLHKLPWWILYCVREVYIFQYSVPGISLLDWRTWWRWRQYNNTWQRSYRAFMYGWDWLNKYFISYLWVNTHYALSKSLFLLSRDNVSLMTNNNINK